MQEVTRQATKQVKSLRFFFSFFFIENLYRVLTMQQLYRNFSPLPISEYYFALSIVYIYENKVESFSNRITVASSFRFPCILFPPTQDSITSIHQRLCFFPSPDPSYKYCSLSEILQSMSRIRYLKTKEKIFLILQRRVKHRSLFRKPTLYLSLRSLGVPCGTYSTLAKQICIRKYC